MQTCGDTLRWTITKFTKSPFFTLVPSARNGSKDKAV
jgi:hypothetical protein